MSKVYLISETVLKNETILSDNLGAEYIGPAIETSQDIYLQQAIGTMLLDKLYDIVTNNTVEEPYKTLLDDYIAPYLKYKVLAEITIPLAYKYRNAGVVQSTGDHYQQSTLRDATMVQNHYETRATFYHQRLSQYLNANSNLFPEYRDMRDSADMMADSESYKTNWVL